MIVEISLALSTATLAALAIGLSRASARFGALELKVDTMWDFQMRRAFSEVISTGLGTMKSPLSFTADAQSRLDPIKDELVAFYAELTGTSDRDMLLKIEECFGDALLRLVCVPCGLSHGACLLLALTVAKQENSISLERRKTLGDTPKGIAERRQ